MINDNTPELPTELQVMKALHMEVQTRADALYTLLKHVEAKKLHLTPEQSEQVQQRRATLLEARDRLHEHVLAHAAGKEEARHEFDKSILQIIELQIGKIDALMSELKEYIQIQEQ